MGNKIDHRGFDHYLEAHHSIVLFQRDGHQVNQQKLSITHETKKPATSKWYTRFLTLSYKKHTLLPSYVLTLGHTQAIMTKHHRVQLFSKTIFLHQKHITTGTRHSEITCVSGSREGKCVRVWLSQKSCHGPHEKISSSIQKSERLLMTRYYQSHVRKSENRNHWGWVICQKVASAKKLSFAR